MLPHTDARGNTLQQFKRFPKRIVSLVPSQTELLCHLGLEEETIGITKFCIHPNEWFRTKTRVGGTKNPDIEKIKRLAPDLILANKEENEKEQIEHLAAQFPVWVTDVSNLEEALVMIEDIGALTGKKETAFFLKAHIAAAFEGLGQHKPHKPLRACYLIWKDPYLTVGGDTFINSMMHQAGFENVFAWGKRYPEVHPETIHAMNCDVVLLASEPYPFTEKHIPELQSQLPGTKIVLVDGAMFSWYGSRLCLAPDYFRKVQEQLSTLPMGF